MSKLTSPEF